MNTNYSENNYIVLVGKITSEKVFSHEVYGESFYIFNLEIPRLSGTADCIPVTISERLIAVEKSSSSAHKRIDEIIERME